jgi:oligopeptide transport system permease protein
MTSYILKRIGSALITLFVVAAATFFLMNAVPGSPFITEKSTPEMVARAEAKYGLDKPLVVQFFNYVKGYFVGDMGVSLKMQQDTSVAQIIFNQNKFVLSSRIGAYALVLAVVLGVPFGCIAAYNRGNWLDGVCADVVTTIGVAIPGFVRGDKLIGALWRFSCNCFGAFGQFGDARAHISFPCLRLRSILPAISQS